MAVPEGAFVHPLAHGYHRFPSTHSSVSAMSSPAPTAPVRLAGHVLVEALLAQGVDTVFGVPGESFLAVLDGFYEHATARFVVCRQKAAPRTWPRRTAS